MKILHVLYSPRAEGTPRLVLDWLTVPGYEQEILFLTPKGELRTTFEQTDAWQYYNTSFEPRFKNAFRIAALVKKICKERKPDVVIAWYLGFSHWIAFGARQAGVTKNIAHAGNPAGQSFMGKYVHSWITFNVGRALGNIIIGCSDYVRDSFRSIVFVPKTNIFSVYNCTQVYNFLSDPIDKKNENNFIMVATMEAHKDHETLLRAWQIVEKNTNAHQLLLAGDGTLRNKLEMLSKELGLSRVKFLGSRKDIPELLKANNTFVLSTTQQEGFGTVLIEALAAGCQVIATNVPACREVLKEGMYGVMVPEENANKLSQAILNNLSFSLTSEQVNKQQQYALEFTPEKMISNYLRLLV